MFSGCTAAQLARVEELIDVVEVPAGEVLASEQERPGPSFVIVAGEASMVVRDRSVDRLRPGDVVGALASFVPGKPAVATVRAITAMRIAVVDPASLEEFVSIPCVARSLAAEATDPVCR
jgi:CRP-like cAMP-binding protein